MTKRHKMKSYENSQRDQEPFNAEKRKSAVDVITIIYYMKNSPVV